MADQKSCQEPRDIYRLDEGLKWEEYSLLVKWDKERQRLDALKHRIDNLFNRVLAIEHRINNVHIPNMEMHMQEGHIMQRYI